MLPPTHHITLPRCGLLRHRNVDKHIRYTLFFPIGIPVQCQSVLLQLPLNEKTSPKSSRIYRPVLFRVVQYIYLSLFVGLDQRGREDAAGVVPKPQLAPPAVPRRGEPHASARRHLKEPSSSTPRRQGKRGRGGGKLNVFRFSPLPPSPSYCRIL